MMPGPGRKPRKQGRARKGTGSIYWSEKHKCYVGQVSLGTDANGKRIRPTLATSTALFSPTASATRSFGRTSRSATFGGYSTRRPC